MWFAGFIFSSILLSGNMNKVHNRALEDTNKAFNFQITSQVISDASKKGFVEGIIVAIFVGPMLIMIDILIASIICPFVYLQSAAINSIELCGATTLLNLVIHALLFWTPLESANSLFRPLVECIQWIGLISVCFGIYILVKNLKSDK